MVLIKLNGFNGFNLIKIILLYELNLNKAVIFLNLFHLFLYLEVFVLIFFTFLMWLLEKT